ncbi:MAG: hypothetical protein DRP47_02435 [Candidatus Zixiibacteriota bacterium]|nr:MAG: hypothetical protein DRP47_02435 [candidate division Zixibacteria bacterium]
MAQNRKTRNVLKALNYDLFKPESLIPPAPATLYTKIRAATQEPSRHAQTISISSHHDVLPDIADLHRRFDMFNWMFFGGKLPPVKIEYSNRMTSAGSYSRYDHLIKIGRKYHEIFPEEIDDTLKHEMIHIIHFRHDATFKELAARIGASIKAKAHPLLRKPPKYIYVCPECGKEYPRQKRLVMASCGKCSKGRVFDERYKLKLKKLL